MKNVIVTFLFSFFAFNAICQNVDDSMSLDTLKARISRDMLFKNLNDAIDSMVALTATGQVSFKNVDGACIKERQKADKTKEQRLQTYQEAGMKNAQIYLDVVDAITFYSIKIVQKYPMFAAMSLVERQTFMKSIMPPAKKLDRKATFEKRRQNRSND